MTNRKGRSQKDLPLSTRWRFTQILCFIRISTKDRRTGICFYNTYKNVIKMPFYFIRFLENEHEDFKIHIST